MKKRKPGKGTAGGKHHPRLARSILRGMVCLFKLSIIAGFALAVTNFWPKINQGWNHLLRHNESMLVRKVIMEGNDLVTRREVLRLLNLNGGEFLAEVPLDEAARKISELPPVKGVTIKRHYPSGIYIGIIERKPVMIVCDKGERLVDDEGHIFWQSSPGRSDLPRVSGLELTGERIGSTEAISIITELRKAAEASGLSWPGLFAHLDLADLEEPAALTAEGMRIELGRGDYQGKLMRLASVVPRLESIGRTLRYIDLRFAQRVVIGAHPEKGSGEG